MEKRLFKILKYGAFRAKKIWEIYSMHQYQIPQRWSHIAIYWPLVQFYLKIKQPNYFSMVEI